MVKNNLRYHYRFVANGEKTGFERNGEESTEVVLDSKDEIYLTVNGNDNHFFGNWTWETDDKKWISWAGSKISDFHENASVSTMKANAGNSRIYNLQGIRLNQLQRGVNIVGGRKIVR